MSTRLLLNSVPVLRNIYCHAVCEHQKVCEDKEVIIKYMMQKFRILDHLVQATFQKTQYARVRNLA